MVSTHDACGLNYNVDDDIKMKKSSVNLYVDLYVFT